MLLLQFPGLFLCQTSWVKLLGSGLHLATLFSSKMSKRPHFAYFIGEEAVSFLCVSFLRVFEVSSFVVTINFIYILECGTIKGQKIQVLYADLLIEQTGLKKKKKIILYFTGLFCEVSSEISMKGYKQQSLCSHGSSFILQLLDV